MNEKGALPPDYQENLLKPGRTFDGRLIDFTGISGGDLRRIILESKNDDDVLACVLSCGIKKTEQEKRDWIELIRNDRPDSERATARKAFYPDVAKRWDVARLSPFDLVDLDEGRIEKPLDE